MSVQNSINRLIGLVTAGQAAFKAKEKGKLANKIAESKRDVKNEQMKNLKIRLADNSVFELTPEMQARAIIKENK